MKYRFGALESVAVLATLIATMASGPAWAAVRHDDPATIRGAVYVPAEAYSAPQMWKNFNPAETARDLDHARAINLNALRIWASYEFWKTDPDRFGKEFDTFLAIAEQHHIRILVSLFENDGVAPTPANMWTTDPRKAFAIQSPGRAIAAGPKSGWEEPRRFVEWFMKRYGNDDRLLAIEVMNEPNEAGKRAATVPFAKAMFVTAKSLQDTVPLTVGTNLIEIAADFVPLGLDVIQFHDNYPPSEKEFRGRIEQAIAYGKSVGLPVWLTEWQRVRSGGSGWGQEKVASSDSGIDYASLAPIVRSYPIGSFFWSLMVKRAYLKVQRFKGTANGLFWPDGAVASLRDARVIAADPVLDLEERPIPPSFGSVDNKDH
ncbi:MAG TPA: cellulase family glycosylhydrolase [Sphingomonas sp.]|nr:cellulase family glycosylhydrolase [Sphingomonas sp.]